MKVRWKGVRPLEEQVLITRHEWGKGRALEFKVEQMLNLVWCVGVSSKPSADKLALFCGQKGRPGETHINRTVAFL